MYIRGISSLSYLHVHTQKYMQNDNIHNRTKAFITPQALLQFLQKIGHSQRIWNCFLPKKPIEDEILMSSMVLSLDKH